MVNQSTKTKLNTIYLIVAVILVIVFTTSWISTLNWLQDKEKEMSQRNEDIVAKIDKMSCPELGQYISKHEYLYTHASDEFHRRC